MRRTPLVVAGIAAATFLAVAPVSGTSTAFPTAVKGSLQQAYVAEPYRGQAAKGAPFQRNVAVRYDRTPLTLQASYLGRKAAEPTIGVDADGTAFMTASTFDSVVGQARTEVRRSTDGGLTWDTNITTEAPVIKSVPPGTLDPYLYLDKTTNRLYNPELLVAGSWLQWTDDKGATWTTTALCCGNPINDHQTFVTGPPTAAGPAPVGYPNVAYYCFNRVGDSSCSRSLDGGLTWAAAGLPAFSGVCPEGGGHTLMGYASSAIEGHMVVDNKGIVYIPAGHCGRPYLAISRDQALTWEFVLVSEAFPTAAAAGLGQNHLAVDVDEAGTIYFLWWTADTLPLLSSSADGGATWSAPLMIAPPGVGSVNFPTITAGKKGQVAIIFPGAPRPWDYAKKGGDDRRLPWNLYIVTSLNADTQRPLFLSATANSANDPVHRGPCQGRCGGMFDFLDVIYAPNGEIWAAGTDNCTEAQDCAAEGDASRNTSVDGQGVAIRQLSGPGLPEIVAPPGVPKPAPKPAAKPGRLATTGLPIGVALIATGLAGAALSVRRRRTT